MISDPIASMRCWAVGVTLGGREYTIPALPAVSWWPVLADMRASAFLDLIPGTDLTEHLMTGEVPDSEIEEALIEALEETAGRPVAAAMVIAGLVSQHWAVFNGQLVRDGVRWDVLSLAAVLDALHALILERLGDQRDEKTQQLLRDKYLAMLEQPLPGTSRGIDHERRADDFAQIAGPMPTGGVRRPVTDTAEQPARSTVARSAGTPSKTPPPSPPPRPHGRSGAPTERPATPGRSERAARSALPPAGVPRASDIASRPRRR